MGNDDSTVRYVLNLCTTYQRWSPQEHILKFLALASKSQVLENCPVFGSRTALFFEPLQFYWKRQKPRWKFAKSFFASLIWRSPAKNFRRPFFWGGSTLLPLSLTLASSVPVLGLERVCSRKSCPWPRFFFVSLASSLVKFILYNFTDECKIYSIQFYWQR